MYSSSAEGVHQAGMGINISKPYGRVTSEAIDKTEGHGNGVGQHSKEQGRQQEVEQFVHETAHPSRPMKARPPQDTST